MTVKHKFNGYEVEATSIHAMSGTNAWYCSVVKDGKQVLSVTMEADSSREAARMALDLVVVNGEDA